MAASSKITAAFTATAQGMQKGIGKVVESLNKVTKASQKTNKQLSSLNTIGKFLVFDRLASYAARATGALVRFGKTTFDVLNRTVQVATNVAEETSKSFQVFGDSAQSIVDFAKSASSLGLAEDQALQAAAGFGSLFKVIGSSEEEAASFSKNLTKLAADMASFNNTTVDEALIALSAGLRGESEPLKRFAVFLNDATLKQEAFASGIIKSTKGTLQPAAKALAAYNVILKQTTQQQGDFARTAGGLANLSRIVTAQATNLAGAIGKSFEPIWRGAAEAIGKVLGALEPLAAKVSETVSKTAEAIGTAVAIIGQAYADFISKLDPVEIGESMAKAFREAALMAARWADTLRLTIYEAKVFFLRMESILSDLFKEIKILADALGRVAVRDTGYSDVGAEIQYKRYERMIERGRKLTDEQAAKMERLRQQFTRTGEFAPDTTKLEKKIAALPVPISLEETFQDAFDEADRLAAQIASTPTVARPGKDNTIANFQNLVASALSDGTKEAAKQNKISGLDARSQAGLNFLLESGVAGKKPEEEIVKNTKKTNDLISRTNQLINTPLTVAIP
jgi:hypothetical protein